MLHHLALILFLLLPQAPPAHQVILNWTESTTPAVTGNCIYRAGNSGGPYTQLFCSQMPIATYADATVNPDPNLGTTYYYVVTALVGSVESLNSNEVSAIYAPAPSPPTNLTDSSK